MTTGWTLAQLHEELATYYGQFPKGSTVPMNNYVKSLWDAIERAERDEEAA